jgi:hypothetical protein
VTASGVELPRTTDPAQLHWVDEACARIAADLTRDRARYGRRPAAAVTTG